MQGTWAAKSTKGWEEQTTFKTVARESVVVEESINAHPGETMLTVFHLDGDRLILTHYCVAKNQPRLVASSISEDGRTLTFTFLDATNPSSRDKGHMDKAVYHFTDEDHFTNQWTWYSNGSEQWMEKIENKRVGSQTPISSSSLPSPSGPYRVGTRILPTLVDKARPDNRFVRGYRAILVQLWYPTSAREGVFALYFPDPELVDYLRSNSSSPDESWREWRTHAIENGPVKKGKYPLIVFSPGFGMAREYYTSWMKELASHGFIVAAVDHPYVNDTRMDGKIFAGTPNPDGPKAQTSEIVTDIRVVLSALAKERGVDKRKTAVVGHSIRGAAALDACSIDTRIVSCVNLDGDPSFGRFATTGVGRPFLVIHQKPVFPEAKPDDELFRIGSRLDVEWQEIIGKQSAPAVRLSVRGTGHLSFTDAIFIRPDLVKEGKKEEEFLQIHSWCCAEQLR